MERGRHAFTIIELLVVIAIIAILAAILFPVFARAKDAGMRTRDLLHIRQLSHSELMYNVDYDDVFLVFPFADVWSNPGYSNREKGPFWSDRLMPYVKSQDIFANIVNRDTVYYASGYWLPGASGPSDTQSKYRVTYAPNHMISRADRHPDRPGATHASAIDVPGEIVLIGPGQQAFTFSSCQEDPAGSRQMHYYWNISEDGQGYGFELWGGKNHLGGFFGGANFSFVAGHAKFMRATDGGTHPGDLYGWHGRDLFRAYFKGAKTRNLVGTDGTCPSFRGDAVY
ncbi:prepilin-type N-terminal cleavage/methylation domain-containing protein [Kamptonema cortianum]|nr:prepilin-type N-terminal cleavage/methylation domain-containing protein [Geitlerinema splendidum]MDK3156155.1 prepilin-type N-terminal cleavage/methylation domain-containing protein [Kamptonema cortianum]